MKRQILTAALSVCLVAIAAGQAGKPTNYKGLEVTPVGVERAKNVALIDCPPGTNSVRGNALDGMEFAVVTLAFKVTPAFDAKTMVKKPVLTDASGKTFQTSVAIIDAGSVPEYKCSFPFRVPAGTKVASVAIDTATIDVASLDR